jgi:hypothetical protein
MCISYTLLNISDLKKRRVLDLDKHNLKHNLSKKQFAFAIIALLSIAMVGIVAWQPNMQANASLQPMTLTVVALNGTQIILNQNEIGNLTSYQAYGGLRKSSGTIANLGNYTGVPITTLLNMVGGIRNGYSVKIMALGSSPYSQTLSYPNLNGTGLNTYSSTTGALVQHNQTLTPMLAYYYNGANLTSGGPLRLVIVGPEGLCTDGKLWVQNVSRLEIHPNLQPMNLTLVALNGTSITLNQAVISNLPAIRSLGAERNRLGHVSGLGNYTGSSLNTLCDLVGGLNNNTALRITATDNYTQTLSYNMVNGAFTTYNLTTGNPTPHYQSLTPILAYYFNDANLTTGASGNGPLMLAIVGPEGLATASSLWVKWVIKLEIRHIDDVAVTAAAPLRPAVGQGYSCNVSVTVANHGGYNETFTVTAYANQTTIGEQTITLPIGNSTTITFKWNTTGFAYGNYTISATVTLATGETNSWTGPFTYGTVRVTIPGDANGDGVVDASDFFILERAWGTSIGQKNYDPRADFNGDGVVDAQDFYILEVHWGMSVP